MSGYMETPPETGGHVMAKEMDDPENTYKYYIKIGALWVRVTKRWWWSHGIKGDTPSYVSFHFFRTPRTPAQEDT